MVRRWVILALSFFLVGCGDGPHSRLGPLLGVQIEDHVADPLWPEPRRIGLVLHSDATGPDAAPSISQPFLETLGRRTEAFLIRRCGIATVEPIEFPSQTGQEQIREEFISRGQKMGISHLLLVVLSSREYSGPVTLGEERMMTQMSGAVVENTAFAEVALLRLADYVATFNLPGSATEDLELLDVPIGKGQPTRHQSLEILRAQAGQQALDRSLHNLGRWCEGIPEKN
ncbi:MAG: hypothetical protein WD032_03160 [Nitrospirales bacterium]